MVVTRHNMHCGRLPPTPAHAHVIPSLSTAASKQAELTQHTVSNWPGPVMVLPAAVVFWNFPAGQLREVPLPNGSAQVPSTVTVSTSTLLVLLLSMRVSCTVLTLAPVVLTRAV